MGQQQLILIILGVIVVGVTIAVAITMFLDNSISSNRDAVTSDLVSFATRARQYYRRPASMGGGGGSFAGLTADPAGFSKLTARPRNNNGRFEIVAPGGTDNSVTLRGVGMELVNSTDSVEVTMQVKPDSAIIRVIH